MFAAVGRRAGAVGHVLGGGVPVGARTPGPADVHWAEPGRALGQVSERVGLCWGQHGGWVSLLGTVASWQLLSND